MRKLMMLSVVAVVALVTGGCGALFNGGPQMVAFTSNPTGAEVWVDGTPRGVTPTSLGLTKNQNHTVLFKLAGYGDFGTEITKHVSGGLVVLDILGGVLPVVIDAATGSWYKLSANSVHGSLAVTDTEPDGQLTMQQLNLVNLGVSIDEALRRAPQQK